MKHLLPAILLSFLCFTTHAQTSTWDGSSDTQWYDPDSAEYHITTAAELAGLSELVNQHITFSGKTIHLEADINLDGQSWTPIGGTYEAGSIAEFQGIFNGNMHTISNLRVNAAYLSSIRKGYALFGMVGNGTKIYDLILNKGSISAAGTGNTLIGALIGNATILGGTLDVSNVKSNLTIYGNNTTGGLMGYIYVKNGTAKFSKLINLGNVSGANMVGGLIGDCGVEENATFNIQDCYSSSTVSGTNDFAGGLIGAVIAIDPAVFTINNCFIAGSVSCAKTAGGLVGSIGGANNSKTTISNNLIYLNNLQGVGNIGRITSQPNRARLSNNYATVSNGSWTSSASGKDGADWTLKLSQQPVSGWDLANTWEIPDYNYFPKIIGMPGQPDIAFNRNATAIEETKAMTKNIYSDNASVIINSETGTGLSIYSVTGQLQVSRQIPAGETRISLPKGFYIVKAGKDVSKVVVR